MVEQSENERDFVVCALLPPDTTSFRKIALPPTTKLHFRVRAFFYGDPSKPASLTTPAEPPGAVKPL